HRFGGCAARQAFTSSWSNPIQRMASSSCTTLPVSAPEERSWRTHIYTPPVSSNVGGRLVSCHCSRPGGVRGRRNKKSWRNCSNLSSHPDTTPRNLCRRGHIPQAPAGSVFMHGLQGELSRR